ncbi:hypothetical protein CIHG_00626 [Coccidioides immitis H538.4]|uniref:Uncharacterized protein n=3 Tax=Coccidioides immitis TaxID=5501 RepID=A0A0J8QHF9_COCIT|nr:hypothetical protein CIRG_07435 [Coccidioides immitis RMSCC 2394]KMU71789.1 hypothetical protein CISG_00099 [Coccidioides immitis RMSCC 3703]KMU82842.1 hypothetical protein CIHG_00626 [Coccidioides immitis H538.4]
MLTKAGNKNDSGLSSTCGGERWDFVSLIVLRKVKLGGFASRAELRRPLSGSSTSTRTRSLQEGPSGGRANSAKGTSTANQTAKPDGQWRARRPTIAAAVAQTLLRWAVSAWLPQATLSWTRRRAEPLSHQVLPTAAFGYGAWSTKHAGDSYSCGGNEGEAWT